MKETKTEEIKVEKIRLTDFFDIPPPKKDKKSKYDSLYLKIREELIHKGKDPVTGSNFDKNTRKFRHFKPSMYLKELEAKNYNALVMYDNNYLYGYAAYQRQGDKLDEMHIFKIIVDEKAKGHLGLIRKLIGGSLSHAREKGIKKIVFDKESRELVEFLKRRERNFGISVNLEENSLCFNTP